MVRVLTNQRVQYFIFSISCAHANQTPKRRWQRLHIIRYYRVVYEIQHLVQYQYQVKVKVPDRLHPPERKKKKRGPAAINISLFNLKNTRYRKQQLCTVHTTSINSAWRDSSPGRENVGRTNNKPNLHQLPQAEGKLAESLGVLLSSGTLPPPLGIQKPSTSKINSPPTTHPRMLLLLLLSSHMLFA